MPATPGVQGRKLCVCHRETEAPLVILHRANVLAWAIWFFAQTAHAVDQTTPAWHLIGFVHGLILAKVNGLAVALARGVVMLKVTDVTKI
jgi:hypothetical protein